MPKLLIQRQMKIQSWLVYKFLQNKVKTSNFRLQVSKFLHYIPKRNENQLKRKIPIIKTEGKKTKKQKDERILSNKTS